MKNLMGDEITKPLDNPIEPFNQDSLFELFATITKAHAFNIVSKQVGELKAIINKLIEVGELEDITFNDPADTHEFQTIVKMAKIAAL